MQRRVEMPQDSSTDEEKTLRDKERREVLKKMGTFAYVVPATVMLVTAAQAAPVS